MKSEKDVRRRLKKLRMSLLRKVLRESQERRHSNCVYNYQHKGSHLAISESDPIRMASPSKSSSLAIIQNDPIIHLCLYGSENPAEWEGLVCDNDDIAKRCKWFKPKVSANEAMRSVVLNLADDHYVFDNHKDIAALQWVLGERVHAYNISLLDRIILFFKALTARPGSPVPALPPPDFSDSDLEALWKNDPSQDS